MAKLRYKTAGDVSPKGKPRVYFSCYGEDFRSCFQEITDELLRISSCAIYYYEEEPDLDEDYYLNLGQMQLIVMPVTSRLLYMPCRAMDVDFPYAVAHHIPVLPLMQEQGLAQRFNEKCGDLQFLDKYDPDPTALPYADKLKRYLEAVLVNDELAAKIRAAFDAYIFLSYRKKDRKFAQELMRLIHRNPLCRDIAIWYDEFLTPGENFNDSIREALEKSGLFVLTVTPNLVNEINYVMTTEYPMAKAAGKKILSVRMQPTDPAALREKYDGIPDSIDPQEEGVLTDALLNALRDLALRENVSDPQHNFFIGLAYLSGIDVEVDHEYAVKLIVSAAGAGLIEAMEKLASMYENGEGVRRDLDISIQWRIAVVDTLRARYEQSGETADCYVYVMSVKRLLWHLSILRRSAYALDVAQQMTDVLPELVKKEVSEDALHCVTEGFQTLSALYLEIGEYELAAAYYDNTCGWAELLAKNSGKVWAFALLANCYRKRGDTALQVEGSTQAEEWYRKAVDTLEFVAKETDLPEQWEELSDLCQDVAWSYDYHGTERIPWLAKSADVLEGLYKKCGEAHIQKKLLETYGDLGRLCAENGRQEESQSWYQKSLDFQAHQSGSSTGASSLKERCEEYIRVAETYTEAGKTDDAMAWYQRTVKLAENGGVHKDSAWIVDVTARCFGGLGNACLKAGDRPGAQAWWEKAIAVRERLAADTGAEDALRAQCDAYGDIARFYEKCGCSSRQREYLIKYTGMVERLDRQGISVCPLYFLMVYYYSIGDLFLEEDDDTQALYWYHKSFEICEQRMKQDVSCGMELADGYASLGRRFQFRGKYSKAKEWLGKAAELLIPLTTNDSSVSVLEKWISVNRWLGEVCCALGEDSNAKQCYCRAYEANARLSQEDLSVQNVYDAAELCEAIVELCEKLNDPGETVFWLKELLSQIGEVKRRGGWCKDSWDAALVCGKLAQISRNNGDWGTTMTWCYQLLEYRLERNKATGSMKTELELSDVYFQLGEACEAMEMTAQAETWYTNALNIRLQLSLSHGTAEEKRGTAKCYESLGDVSYTKTQLQEARRWYAKAVDSFAELAGQTQQASDFESTARACYKLGLTAKDPQKLRSALNIYTELSKIHPNVKQYRQNMERISGILRRYC